MPHLQPSTPDLTPPLAAEAAVRPILRHLLEVIEATRPEVGDGKAPEALHDLRVAVRRTRVLLGQLRDLWPEAERARFRTEFRWLGEVTGPVRDLELLRQRVAADGAQLPARYRDALPPLLEALAARQRKRQQELTEQLEGPRCRQLLADWSALLAAPLHGPGAAAAIDTLAGRRVDRLYRRALRQGRRVAPENPASYHALRITLKKLRYLAEFFGGLHRPKAARKLITELKQLQDLLGAHHDLTVQFATLEAFAAAPEIAGRPQTLLALGLLMGLARARRQHLEAEFAKSFAAFAAPRTRTRVRRLFPPRTPD